jgi:hypothetical protein
MHESGVRKRRLPVIATLPHLLPRAETSHEALASRAVLFLAVLAGTFLRLFRVGVMPLCFDEALSVFIAQGPIAEVLSKNLVYNSSPPFMALALRQMLNLGQSEMTIRLLPALAGIATIFVVYRIARRLCARLPAALAALLYALSPAHISLSREYRIYEIGSFFSALGILAALEFLRRPGPRRAVIAGAVMFCSIHVQYGLALLVAAIAVALLLCTCCCRLPAKRACLSVGIILSCAVAGAVTVYLVSLRAQFYVGRGSTYGAQWAHNSRLLDAVMRLPSRTWELCRYALPTELFVLVLCVGLGLLFWRNVREPTALVLVCSLAFTAALSIVNWYPYGAGRQCLFLTIMMYPIAAVGLEYFLKVVLVEIFSWLRVWCLAVLITPVLLVDVKACMESRDTWDISAALKEIDREFGSGDSVFVAPRAYPLFLYYGRDFPHPWVKAEGTEAWMSDERAWTRLAANPPYVRQIESLCASRKRMWLLFADSHPGEPRLSEIAARYGWGSGIEVRLVSESVTLGVCQGDVFGQSVSAIPEAASAASGGVPPPV